MNFASIVSNLQKDFTDSWKASPAWHAWPLKVATIGAVLGLIGLMVDPKQFAYSYLTAFMFFLSVCLGGMILVILHHLFDASWSVPVRRITEHLAFLAPVLMVLFIPIALLAKTIYPWMSADPHTDHALHVKHVLFNPVAFYVVSALLFVVWTWLAGNLRRLSLEQDKTGSVACTRSMRRFAAVGVFIFAFSLTLAAIFWMKGLQHQWFSTMYGVYYFAGSTWMTLGLLYMIALYLVKSGPLKGVVGRRQFHDIGVLMFAFTVFYAYIHFSQYFLIWNAAIPEETFWYIQREQGSWEYIGYALIFVHFAIPFIMLLPIRAKLNAGYMTAVFCIFWVMHYLDMAYNVIPLVRPEGMAIKWIWLDAGCWLFLAGILSYTFWKYLKAHPAFPQKDPRMAEALGVYVEPLSQKKA